MPLPSVNVTLRDVALLEERSIRDAILRTALHRPCTHQVLVEVCVVLERLLRTRVSLRFHEEERHVVHGLHRSPVGFTRGRDQWIEVTVELATYNQLNEIETTLRDIAPAGTEVHVMAGDGRTAGDLSEMQRLASYAYGIERREPSTPVGRVTGIGTDGVRVQMGDGLSLNLSEGTPYPTVNGYLSREELLTHRVRQEIPPGGLTRADLDRVINICRETLGIGIGYTIETGGPLRLTFDGGGEVGDQPLVIQTIQRLLPAGIGVEVQVRAQGKVENIQVDVWTRRTVWEHLLDDVLDDEAA